MTFLLPFGRATAVAMLVCSLIAPHRAHAHGETLIRIAAVTQQIEAATTNVAQLYLSRGDLHREHQDWTAAEADYAQAAKLEPHLVAVKLCQAALLSDTGRVEAAEALFTKALSESPREGEAFIGRARVRLKLERRKDAIADFQRGIELLPSSEPEYFLRLADALVADGRSAEALRTLDDGIKRVGPLIPLLGNALQIELKQNDLEPALRRVDKILEVAPRKENWLAQRGDILLLSHRPTEAQHSFTAALKAIDALPPRIKQSPAILELISRVRAAITTINAKSVVTGPRLSQP
ncbi:MAG: uncharacterized protein JWM68_773 [Verrucomicrobiales bacterium]|nr:uncharacterized protein [Verrucomicrobiales bacterium]